MAIWIIIFSAFLSTILGYLRHKFNYWDLLGVKQLKTHFLFGNLFQLKSLSFQEVLHEVYTTFKGKARLAGFYIFLRPVAVIVDLDLVKTILIKDFSNFVNRSVYSNEEEDPLSGHLFMARGEKWKNLRTKLSPTFTSGKMKFMFPTIAQVANEFKKSFEVFLEQSDDKCLEMHDFNGRFTTDVIGSCVFGIQCNSLKDPRSEFRNMGKKIFYPNLASIRLRLLKQNNENILKYFGIKRFEQDIVDFFMKLIRDTVTFRETENVSRNDFVDILMELKNNKSVELSGLTIEEMAAQCFVFFAAGFETSSSNMSYGLFELAKNPHVQHKLRDEIKTVLAKHNNQLTYEAMMEMAYLDQVISETLRKYPALAFLSRYVKENYKIPDSDIVLEKGTQVMIPVKEIHYDPEIYDNPNEFRPERFSPSETRDRHPEAFLGFGDGPRNCIGLRFGRMQVKVGLITLLSSFKFSFCEKTPKEVDISRYSFVMVPAKGVWLKAEKL